MPRIGLQGLACNRAIILLLRYAWLVLVSMALTISVLLSVSIFHNQDLPHSRFMDFTVFWTAARFDGAVYDVHALTAAQLDRLPLHWTLRPFPYPPSTLLLIKPLALLPYGPALLLWTAAGIAAFAAGALTLGRRALAAFAMLPVGLAMLAGQMSLFIGGAISGSVGLLRRNEVAAGLLFGLAAAAKPQSVLLVPVALLAGGHWKSLAASAVALVLIALSSLCLGAHLWLDWIHAMPQFVEQTSKSPYRELNIALGPTYAPVGIVLVAVTFWRVQSASVRLLALSVGQFLCVPYMLIYDLTAACPALAALLLAPLAKLLSAERAVRDPPQLAPCAPAQ